MSVRTLGHEVSVRPRTVGLDERPGAVADHADRLAGREDRLDEAQRVGVGSQRIGVRDAAGQHEPVVVVGIGVRDDDVDGEAVALVEMVEGLDLTGLCAEQVRARARVS